MITIQLKVKSRLHARLCVIISKRAETYLSRMHLSYDGKIAELRSTISLMLLGVQEGSKVQLDVQGADEVLAVAEMQQLLEGLTDEGFGG
ncbi:HPr family phosphocarrier protein [Paenibacillus sp. GSMTC-2017]|uniref:HPr family phosphocarrier protein n=1 Tax=Paenibacillus sp. GSMTC-2017 TaxID=2794350 RepID=UPI0018D9E701|nr:HPr family phosphocarrier protein [Paenibacillus sp. GSMTC-2017]MBH5320697.1 HPr family phosphocarrier protein [Paenibacillus sp. GSMTC-2017]